MKIDAGQRVGHFIGNQVSIRRDLRNRYRTFARRDTGDTDAIGFHHTELPKSANRDQQSTIVSHQSLIGVTGTSRVVTNSNETTVAHETRCGINDRLDRYFTRRIRNHRSPNDLTASRRCDLVDQLVSHIDVLAT